MVISGYLISLQLWRQLAFCGVFGDCANTMPLKEDDGVIQGLGEASRAF
jgi:hypothetical protein